MRLICLLIVISTNYMVPNFTAKNLVNAGGMFQNGRCTEINFPEMESKLENADDMFKQSYTTKDRCKAIRFPKISIIGIGSKAETTVYNLFSGRHNLEKVKLKNNFLEPRTEYSRFNLFYTFSGCKKFNDSSICNWDVSRVRTFAYMFNDAEIFNQNLSAWDVSNATNFSHMFANAKSFVGFGLGQWKLFGGDDFLVRKSNNLMSDIYSIYFTNMFYNATSFNANLNSWGKRIFNGLVNNVQVSLDNSLIPYENVKPVSHLMMNSMFENASSFNRSLVSWSLPIRFVRRFQYWKCSWYN